MSTTFVPPCAPMHMKIKAMQNHCILIANENKYRPEFGHRSPLVDNEVLLEALNQRDQLLEALKDALKSVEFERCNFRPWHNKARAAIAAAEGE